MTDRILWHATACQELSYMRNAHQPLRKSGGCNELLVCHWLLRLDVEIRTETCIQCLLSCQLHLLPLTSRLLRALCRTTARSAASLALCCWCAVGSAALGHGDPHERIDVLDALLEQNPDHVANLLERADLYRRHRNFDEALADLKHARLLSPASEVVYYLTGLALLEQGKLNEAESALQEFISRSPNNPRGYVALAKVFTQQQQHLNAAQAYEFAIENQPTPTPDLYLARAQAYMYAGEPYLSQALAGLEEGITSIGPLITFQKLAIEVELAQGNHQNAIDRVDGILRNVDRKETWLVKKAKVLASIGQNEKANQQFLLAEHAIASLPKRTRTSPAIQALRATVHANLNRETRKQDDQNESDNPL